MAFVLDGALAVADAKGHAATGGGPATPLRGREVIVEGALRIAPEPLAASGLAAGPAGFRYVVDGRVDRVLVDGRAPAALAAAAVAAAAGAAGAYALGLHAFRAFAVLYHRIAPASALANPHRQAVLETVRRRPGIHLRALGRELGLTWGRLLHHVAVLERGRFVAVRRRGRYLLLFEVGTAPAVPEVRTVVHPLARRIAEAVAAEGRVRARDLQDRMAVSRQLLSYHVKALARDGLVVVESTPAGLVLAAPAGASPLAHASAQVVAPAAATEP